ncbi:ATPase [Paeniglutamicibacter sp. Y32M11]|uniref:ATPase n=1 Tax=Paeniglutamicibacter sp. Y32M11 TaxID=2853258 RepID=UPI001C531A36|nr:ATPase [Paeniglutamicibacter sp. Y32M11]QXQ11416.1 ATPase [Paeniglutamicibacter sp. Y32M11]
MDTKRQDAIEASIDIHSTASSVWKLVSEPGWFINGGVITEHRIERRGAFSTVHDAIFGTFEFETVRLEEPGYAAFRSLGGDEWDDPVPNTLIEFWVETTHSGDVRLRVMESGFTAFGDEEYDRVIGANTRGWAAEMLAAQRYLSDS